MVELHEALTWLGSVKLLTYFGFTKLRSKESVKRNFNVCVCVCVCFQNSGAFKTIPWGIHSWTSRWDNEWWFGQRDTNSTQGIAVTQPSHKGCWGCAAGTQGRRNPPWPAQWGDRSPLQNPSSYSLHSFDLVFSFSFFSSRFVLAIF